MDHDVCQLLLQLHTSRNRIRQKHNNNGHITGSLDKRTLVDGRALAFVYINNSCRGSSLIRHQEYTYEQNGSIEYIHDQKGILGLAQQQHCSRETVMNQ
jgi:hypothetical protein